jgi:hypothetical protein
VYLKYLLALDSTRGYILERKTGLTATRASKGFVSKTLKVARESFRKAGGIPVSLAVYAIAFLSSLAYWSWGGCLTSIGVERPDASLGVRGFRICLVRFDWYGNLNVISGL